MCIRSINVVFLICAFVSLAAFGFQMGYHWVPSDYRTPSAPAWTLPCLVYLIFGYTRQVVRKSPVEGVKFFWIVSGVNCPLFVARLSTQLDAGALSQRTER